MSYRRALPVLRTQGKGLVVRWGAAAHAAVLQPILRDILLRKQKWKFCRCRGEEALISERFMEDRTNLSAFPKHFDGKRFYNPDAPQALGFLDALRWKLTSRPEQSPRFIWDVEPTIPPSRVDGKGLRVTLVNDSTVLLQQRGSNILTDPTSSERATPFSRFGPPPPRNPTAAFDAC